MSVYVDDAFAGDWGKWTGGGHLRGRRTRCALPRLPGHDRCRPYNPRIMAPLTRTQILDRMRENDNAFATIGNEYGDVAGAKVTASAERAKAIADAYMAADGNSTDRRQAALKVVGMLGIREEAAYAKIAADFELRHARAVQLESMLKKSSDEDPRYRS